MHKLNIFFIILLHSTIFCSQQPLCSFSIIHTNVTNPENVEWIDKDYFLVTGENGAEIIDGETKILSKQICPTNQIDRARSYVATNELFYAVALGEEVSCFDVSTHKRVWKFEFPNHKPDLPITFVSDDTHDLVCLIKHKTKNRSTLHSLPSKKSIVKFNSQDYCGPLSWCSLTDQIVLHKNKGTKCSLSMIKESAIVTINVTNDHANPIVETKYSPLEDKIIVNYGNVVKLYNPEQGYTKQTVAMNCDLYQASDMNSIIPTTKTAYISFEFYDNNILVLLSQSNVIQVINLEKQRIIKEFYADKITHNTANTGSRLSISPNRNYLVALFQDRCYMLPMAMLLNQTKK